MELKKEIIDAIEEQGWSIKEYGKEDLAEISQYSPAGEDYSFTVSISNIKEDIYNQYDGFDCDEHIRLMMNATGAPSIQRLCEDAEDIAEMLKKLSGAVFAV